MKTLLSLPHVEDAPDELLDSGHLWLLEHVVGAPLRFRLRASGLIEFGDPNRVYDSPDDLPAQYQHAVRHIQTQFDREALRAAVEDVETIVFSGVATQYQGIEYDWDRLPSFLGVDSWSADADQFRPPDAVDGIYNRLGLDPINPLEQEVRARDFDPASYGIPDSAWYDGPAAGVVIRNKQGHRALLPNPAVPDTERTPLAVDDQSTVDEQTTVNEQPTVDEQPTANETPTADELAARYGSTHRLERLSKRLTEAGQPVTVDALVERTIEASHRELDPRLFETSVDHRAFRSALAGRIQQFMNDQ